MPPTLSTISTLLYGPHWQSELARALGVSDRTVRRWAAGQAPPEGVWQDIARLARERLGELQEAVEGLS